MAKYCPECGNRTTPSDGCGSFEAAIHHLEKELKEVKEEKSKGWERADFHYRNYVSKYKEWENLKTNYENAVKKCNKAEADLEHAKAIIASFEKSARGIVAAFEEKATYDS